MDKTLIPLPIPANDTKRSEACNLCLHWGWVGPCCLEDGDF